MRKQELSEGRKVILFLLYTAGMYACTIAAAIFEEKLYKVPYPRNSNPALSDIFTDKITPLGLIAGVACLLGFVFMNNEQMTFNIPISKLLKVAACDTIVHVCLVSALLMTTYTTYIVVNTLSLISVILVGAFCTGVKYESAEYIQEGQEDISDEPANMNINSDEKIGPEKLYFCGVVCLGIIIFSIFSNQTNAPTATTASGGIIAIILLYGAAITLEGFRPDFVAVIKHQHHPSSLFLYFSVNGVIFCLVMAVSVITWNIKYFVTFALNHQQMLIDLSAYCLLFAMGGIFGYKLVNTFRQHIYPLVSNTRKCLTVCINVAWYGHHLSKMQWLGIFLVFSGVMIEITSNYDLKSKLFPKKKVWDREVQPYNKIEGVNQEETSKRYEGHISQGVQGI